MEKGIKRILGLLIFSIITLITTPQLKAASGSINVSSNTSSTVVGNTINVTVTISTDVPMGGWEYLLTYDSGKLMLVSGSASEVDSAPNASTYSRSFDYSFKVIASGTSTISVTNVLVLDMNSSPSVAIPMSIGSTTISGITYQELEASYSKNNNLSSISVNGYELSPKFDKDTLEYKVKVPSNVEKITISADREDSTASVSGTGEFDVTEGDNKFELVVTAQNGGTKTYKVVVTVEDENPIIKEIDGEKYTLIKRKSTLKAPSTYKETTIKINNIEVPAFTSEITGYTLVGMKNSKGESHLFIYDKEDDTYTLYREIKTESIIIFPKKTKIVPDYYKITKVKINGEEVEAYQYDGVKDYYLIYGVNIQTNEEGFYEYDMKNNTITRYNDKIIKELTKKIENFQLIIIILGAETALLVVIVLIVLVKKNKKNKNTTHKESSFKDFERALENDNKKEEITLEEKLPNKKTKKDKNKKEENML